MKKAKISVLIPTYNRPDFLRDCLNSVVNQSVTPYEVIVADDNTDLQKSEKNREVVEEFSKKYPFVVYHKNPKNLGPSQNYKNLFFMATGDLIQFIGDGDILSPVALEKLSRPLIENKDIFISAGKTFFVDKELNFSTLYLRNSLFFSKIFKSKPVSGKTLIKLSYMNGIINLLGSFSGFMFRKKDVDFPLFNFNGYEFTANSDMFLWMNIAKKGKVFLYKDILNLFRLHGENDSLYQYNKGLEELCIFYSDDFLENLGLKLNNRTLYHKAVTIYRYYDSEQSDTANVEMFYKKKTFTDRERFSIIIVTYKNEDTIQVCLSSIVKTLKEGDEIVVVDNSPDELTGNLIKKFSEDYPFVRYIKNDTNVGYSRAANIGAKLAKNNYLVFLNPDTVIVSVNWLDRFYAKFKEDEKIAAIGPVSNAAFFKNNIFHYGILDIHKLPIHQLADILEKTYGDKHIETGILSGFCLATRKSVFLDYGGFDENLILGYDDFDYSMFLKDNNYKQVVIPSVLIYHKSQHSFEKDKSNADILSKQSFDYFMKKLISRYGYGNVPEPYEYFLSAKLPKDYDFFNNLVNGRYRFAINFSGKLKDKSFFRIKSSIIKSVPKISIVTVNYKTSEYVLELAKSVVNSNYKNIDLVVVDNSEDDEEVEKLRYGLGEIFGKSGKNYHIIKNINNGYAGGNNIGIKYSVQHINPAYIWLLNPDTIIGKGAALELVKTVEYTDVPVATCKIIDYTDHYKVHYNGKHVSYTGLENTGKKKGDNIFRVKFLSGANIFMKKEVIDIVGLLDERYFLYFEDNEFFERLKKNNIYPLYTPFAHVYHKGAVTVGGFLKSPVSVYYYVRNMLHFREEEIRSLKNADNIVAIVERLSAEIKLIYLKNITKKQMLYSIILGIEDYLKGVFYKVNLYEKLNNISYFSHNKKFENGKLLYWNVIDKIEHLKSRPKDIETMEGLVEDIIKLKFSNEI